MFSNILFNYDETQARNQLGTPGGAKSFLRGAQMFWTTVCPIVFNHIQHIFPGGVKNFLGGYSTPWLRPWWNLTKSPHFERVVTFHSLLCANTKCGLEEIKIVMFCSVTATSDSQKTFGEFLHALPHHVTLVIFTTSELLSGCFNHIRRNGFRLGFVRVPRYAKSQSCVKAVSPDVRQRRGIDLRSRLLLRHAMCYS